MTTPFQLTLGQLAEPVTDDDHIRGPATAPVTLVEYGDYQCPYCGAAHPILKELLRQRPAEVRMVYRHFPLTNVHQYAELAAEVAEAAGARQQFWQMHDWLFTHQEELSPVTLRLGVEQLGLSVEEVDLELRDHLYLDRIHRDFIGGVRSGVNGTPTFFINGIRHDHGYTLPELLLAVDEAANNR
jgi:protein-disulfide isomerase